MIYVLVSPNILNVPQWHIFQIDNRLKLSYISECGRVDIENKFLNFIQTDLRLHFYSDNSSLSNKDFNIFKSKDINIRYECNRNQTIFRFDDIKDIRLFIGLYCEKNICGQCVAGLYS